MIEQHGFDLWFGTLQLAQYWNALSDVVQNSFIKHDSKMLLKLDVHSRDARILLCAKMAIIPAHSKDRLLLTSLAKESRDLLNSLMAATPHKKKSVENLATWVTQNSIYPVLLSGVNEAKCDAKSIEMLKSDHLAKFAWQKSFQMKGPIAWLHEWNLSEAIRNIASVEILDGLHRYMQFMQNDPAPFSFEDADLQFEDPKDTFEVIQAGVELLFLIPEWNFKSGMKFHWAFPIDAKIEVEVKDETIEGGFLLNDIINLLRIAQKAPIPWAYTEDRPHKRLYDQIVDQLTSLPDWWFSEFLQSQMVSDRPMFLINILNSLNYTSVHLLSGTKAKGLWALHLQDKGVALLTHDSTAEENLLCALVAPCSPIRTAVNLGVRSVSGQFFDESEIVLVRQEIARLFAEFPVGKLTNFNKFLERSVKHPNFISKMMTQRKSLWGMGSHATPENFERAFRTLVLMEMLWNVQCGVFNLQYNTKSRLVWLELTPIGHYLLTGKGAMPTQKSAEGAVLIKPDFEVAFMQENGRAESILSAYCERIHKGHVGVLFRITQASIMHAFTVGITGEMILTQLHGFCERVPKNVLEQIQGWQDSVRIASLRHTHILVLQDELTARHCASIFPSQLNFIGGPVVEVIDAKKMKEITTKLARENIVIRKFM